MRIGIDLALLAALLKAEQLSLFGAGRMRPTGVAAGTREVQVRAHTRRTKHGAVFVDPHTTHVRRGTPKAEATAAQARAAARMPKLDPTFGVDAGIGGRNTGGGTADSRAQEEAMDEIKGPDALAKLIMGMDGVASARNWQHKRVYVDVENLNGRVGRAPFYVELATKKVVKGDGWSGARTRDAAHDLMERVAALLPQYDHQTEAQRVAALPTPPGAGPAPADLRTVESSDGRYRYHLPIVVEVEEKGNAYAEKRKLKHMIFAEGMGGVRITALPGEGRSHPHSQDLDALITTHGGSAGAMGQGLPADVDPAEFVRAARADGFVVNLRRVSAADDELDPRFAGLSKFSEAGRGPNPPPLPPPPPPSTGVTHTSAIYRKLGPKHGDAWGAAIVSDTVPQPGDVVHVTKASSSVKRHAITAYHGMWDRGKPYAKHAVAIGPELD